MKALVSLLLRPYLPTYMNKIIILFVLIATGYAASAQQQSLSQLLKMLTWTPTQIDTTLKKEGYLLMHKEVDSASKLYQYSWADRPKDDNAMVRSFNYMDISVKQAKSRMITYRTYNKEEYQQMASWMMENNFHATNKYDFGNAQHTLYSNGEQTVRAKVITTLLKDGRKYVAYEVEIGK
jgi:hypothetical protein